MNKLLSLIIPINTDDSTYIVSSLRHKYQWITLRGGEEDKEDSANIVREGGRVPRFRGEEDIHF